MKYWGEHRCPHVKVAPSRTASVRYTKVGAGSVPFLTDEGWLMFYHGVIDRTRRGYRYSTWSRPARQGEPRTRALPLKALPARPGRALRALPWATFRDVVFPCASIQDGDRVAIYYGAADTCVGLAFGHISEIINHLKENHL